MPMSIQSNWLVVVLALWNAYQLGCFKSSEPVNSESNSIASNATRKEKAPSGKNVDLAKESLRTISMPKEVDRPGMVPVAAVFYIHGVINRSGSDQPSIDPDDDLIIVVWPDGRIVWSGDRIRGGPPYSVGQIKKEAVDELLRKLSRSGAFEPSLFDKTIFSYLDVGTVRMIATDGKNAMMLDSLHEIADEYFFCFTQEGHIWSKSKRSMFELTKKATSIHKMSSAKDVTKGK
jgi:hypothetical protein